MRRDSIVSINTSVNNKINISIPFTDKKNLCYVIRGAIRDDQLYTPSIYKYMILLTFFKKNFDHSSYLKK
jgi:pSer/pThr/pTyr-binding forkhead associated (FHA) protein